MGVYEYEHITPERFLKALDSGELQDECIIDVRELFEWDYWHLEGTRHLPLRELPASLGTLPKDRKIYVICAHGVRSETACRYLSEAGFDSLVNVLGGTAALAAYRGFQYD